MIHVLILPEKNLKAKHEWNSVCELVYYEEKNKNKYSSDLGLSSSLTCRQIFEHSFLIWNKQKISRFISQHC